MKKLVIKTDRGTTEFGAKDCSTTVVFIIAYLDTPQINSVSLTAKDVVKVRDWLDKWIAEQSQET